MNLKLIDQNATSPPIKNPLTKSRFPPGRPVKRLTFEPLPLSFQPDLDFINSPAEFSPPK